jgi:hypothetical protein
MNETQLKKLINRWQTNIELFVQEAIIDPYNNDLATRYFISEQQKEGLKALSDLVELKRQGKAKNKLGISIMSGKGTGKDAFASWAILWFMMCFPYPKIPCISVSSDQLSKVLWSEISKWLSHSLVKDYFTLQNDKLFYKGAPEEMRGKRWFAFPKAANPKQTYDEQIETLQGIHEDYVLEVCDEVSGVLDSVLRVLEENLTGLCNLMLMIFNPTRSKGYAVDSQYKNSEYWVTLRWSAEDSEMVDKGKIAMAEEKYGRTSNPFRISILGLPPLVDEETLIPWDWIEDAVDRNIVSRETDPLIKGVDCGAGGDKSIIATRKGNKVFPFKRNNTADSHALSNWIGTDIDAERPDTVRVDTIGIGWAIEGELREKKGGIIESGDSRRTADDPERFTNKRAEMYWNMRELFQAGSISIPDDVDFKNELGATKYELDSRGRIKIIDKKKIKQEIGHSPDEADALALTFYVPDSFVSRVTIKKPVLQKTFYQEKSEIWMAG